jgi:hypothetical protein
MSQKRNVTYRLELSSYGLRAIIKSHARVGLALERLMSHKETVAVGMQLLSHQSDHEIINELNALAKRDYFSGHDLFINTDIHTSTIAKEVSRRLKAHGIKTGKIKDVIFMALLTPLSVDDYTILAAASVVDSLNGKETSA